MTKTIRILKTHFFWQDYCLNHLTNGKYLCYYSFIMNSPHDPNKSGANGEHSRVGEYNPHEDLNMRPATVHFVYRMAQDGQEDAILQSYDDGLITDVQRAQV